MPVDVTEHALIVADLHLYEPAGFNQLFDTRTVRIAAIGTFVDECVFHVDPVVRLREKQAIQAFCFQTEGITANERVRHHGEAARRLTELIHQRSPA
ncbi:hypothetical protein A6R70_02020 [Agrobacterium rubi]|nr:hypothetical protein [Agrobacterium rubi]